MCLPVSSYCPRNADNKTNGTASITRGTDVPWCRSRNHKVRNVPFFYPLWVLTGSLQSTGTTWALFALTQSPEVQKKLREELFTVPTDTPTMDELNALPYLDAVVRETMRVHAPVPSTVRVAVADDVLPLSVPLTDLKGATHQSVA